MRLATLPFALATMLACGATTWTNPTPDDAPRTIRLDREGNAISEEEWQAQQRERERRRRDEEAERRRREVEELQGLSVPATPRPSTPASAGPLPVGPPPPAAAPPDLPPVGPPYVPPPLPAPGGQTNLPGELALTWTAPPALVENCAVLMPSDAPVTLAVAPAGGLVTGTRSDVYEWSLTSGDGQLVPSADGMSCRFTPGQITAQAPVVVTVRLVRTDQGTGQREITGTLLARLVAPASAAQIVQGALQGYPLGEWPDPTDRAHLATLEGDYTWIIDYAHHYQRPAWFYPVTEESRHWPISRHLELGDFALDARYLPGVTFPQWVAIDPMLVSKLEDLAGLMHRDGHRFDRFDVIYGFRSPAYNLGRIAIDGDESLKTPFSQHMYGRACDFMIDADGNGILDDLNGDGQITVRDAAVIMHYINVLDRQYRSQGDPRVGGAGLYDHHDFFERAAVLGQSPYTHIDVRGFLTSGGTLFRWPTEWPDTGERILWGRI